MHGLLFGTTLLASFLGGIVALLAPCCVSVMLPSYLATGFRRRSGILAATLIFGVGVAAVIVPIGLGAWVLSALVSGHHFLVFSVGGLAMVIGGLAVLAGWKPQLPLVPIRAPTGTGWAAAHGLGSSPARPVPAAPRSSPGWPSFPVQTLLADLKTGVRP